MKRFLALTMIFMMVFSGTAFAKEKKDIDKIKLRADGEKIEFEIEGQQHELGCRCEPDPEVLMKFEDGFDGDGKKLYFRVKWKTEDAEEIDTKETEWKRRIIAVPLKDAEGQDFAMKLELNFDLDRGVEAGTMYSLWLLGGDEWKDNLLRGKRDVLLRDDLVTIYEKETATPTEVLLTVGKDTIQYKGQEKYILEPVIFNDTGRLMIAAKDVGMVMEGAQTAGFNILWDKNTRTVTLQMGTRTISMSEGDHRWLYMGYEKYTETVPEIRNGIMYLPLREMAEIFDFTALTWDGKTQTLHMLRSAY